MKFIHQVEPYIPENVITAVDEYLRSGGWLTEFRKTRELEEMIAGFVGARHGVVVTSGTVALYLALLGMGIGKGDKVIVPNYTMIASINAIVWAGAEPVIADVEPGTFCLDLDSVKLDNSCKALMYVSINGRHGDMVRVVDFCRENGLALLEDAAQSLGAKSDDKYLGTFGHAGVYSFTPHKIITTGQGGIIVTDNDDIHAKVKKLKDFHRTGPATDIHDGIGFNFKFTDLQAVVGVEQMKGIDFRIQKKKEIFKRYQERLEALPEVKFLPTDLTETPPWFVDVFLPDRETRDSLMPYLKEEGIGSRKFYPPLNHQGPYSHFKRGSFPVSEDLAHKGVWLPSSIGLTDEEIDFICSKIKTFFEKRP